MNQICGGNSGNLFLIKNIAILEKDIIQDQDYLNFNYPEGFNNNNCFILSVNILDSDGVWRCGEGFSGNNNERNVALLGLNNISFIMNTTNLRLKVRIVLMKLS